MITQDELRGAAAVVFRTILDDDALWQALPEDDRNQLIDGMVEEIPKMVPHDQRMQLRAMVALAIHQSNQEGGAS